MADFNSLFAKNKAEKPNHGTYKITWIHYSMLKESSYQYCPAMPEEIETLADRIAGDGKILQNLIVRKTGEDVYEIIAGHKRCAAVRLLVEQRGLEKYAMVPCLVSAENEAKIRFSVISSNTHHEKTPYEIMHELQELEYLIRTFPEEFPDLQTGRMVDRLAKQTGMAKSVVGEYQSIAKNLSETAMKKFEKSEIDKSAASALAGLPVDEQDTLIASGMTQNKEIKAYKKAKKIQQAAAGRSEIPREEKATSGTAATNQKSCAYAEKPDNIQEKKVDIPDTAPWESLYSYIYEYVHNHHLKKSDLDQACAIMRAAYWDAGC